MTDVMRVTQTVILAAGSGSRLADARGDVPKPLMTVGGTPLIEHALAHAHSAGCAEALVVIGHQGERVRAAVQSRRQPVHVRFVTSPDPTLPNGISLLAAESLAADIFYVQMVDHLFGGVALARLTETALDESETGRVLVDGDPAAHLDLDDATKVRLEGRRVRGIGKGLTTWDAIDAGCFVLKRGVFDALRAASESLEGCTVSAGMRRLVAQGRLTAVDLNGIEWADVDTPDDRRNAEHLLSLLASKSGA